MHWILENMPLEFHRVTINSVQFFVILKRFDPFLFLPPCIVRFRNFEKFPKAQHRIQTSSLQNQQVFPDSEKFDLMICGSIEKVPRQANTLSKEDQCRGAESSEGQHIFQKKTKCLFDLWIFSTCWILDEIRYRGYSEKLESDDTQDFDLRREQALLLTSNPPSDKVLEVLFVSRLQDSSRAQTIMALHRQILRAGENEIITNW